MRPSAPRHETGARRRDLQQFRRPQFDSRASSAQLQHLQAQTLRLGGDALGADPTYLLYLPSRPRGALRRIDFGAWPRTAVSPRQIPPGSTCKPLLHTRGISRAKSFDLEVTRWAPARLTSCTFHPGPAEASGASTFEPGPAQQFRRVKFPPNRPASLQRARLSSASPKLQSDRGGPGTGSGYPSVLIS